MMPTVLKKKIKSDICDIGEKELLSKKV